MLEENCTENIGDIMRYKDLIERLDIEKNNSGQLKGIADEKDIYMHIKNFDDESAHAYAVVNGVQFQFRSITLGMQEPSDDAWLLFTGDFNEKCVRISNIKELYFNFKGIRTIHG